MHIGLRTVKTAVGATLAIILADFFNLSFTISAGVIVILSLTNTRKSSVVIGISRLLSLALATAIGGASFLILGYNTIAFGVFLLLFIPSAVSLKLADGIVVCSVLVSHYLAEQSLRLSLIGNEFALMVIGIGFALLMNLYMPDMEQKIKDNQEMIEEKFRSILSKMADAINQRNVDNDLVQQITQLRKFIREAEKTAATFQENHWFSKEMYYSDYFAMRRVQAQVLADMIQNMDKIQVDQDFIERFRELLTFTAETFAEENDGKETLKRIQEVYEYYRVLPLPETRNEFENRSNLFQFFQSFHSFIEIKAEFAQKVELNEG